MAVIDLVCASFDINDKDFSLLVCLDLGADLLLISLFPTADDLFLRVG